MSLIDFIFLALIVALLGWNAIQEYVITNLTREIIELRRVTKKR